MSHNNTVTLVPYSDDILEITARRIVECADSLPDLTRSVVLLPDLQFAPRMRLHLLRHAARQGYSALLNFLEGHFQ